MLTRAEGAPRPVALEKKSNREKKGSFTRRVRKTALGEALALFWRRLRIAAGGSSVRFGFVDTRTGLEEEEEEEEVAN